VRSLGSVWTQHSGTSDRLSSRPSPQCDHGRSHHRLARLTAGARYMLFAIADGARQEAVIIDVTRRHAVKCVAPHCDATICMSARRLDDEDRLYYRTKD
jgi:hypothetical protein